MSGSRYVVSLALGRLGRRGSGALGAALGIAAAAAVLAGVLVGGTVAQDRSVAQDVGRLPADSRAVRASWFGVPAGRDEAWSQLDVAATAELARLPAPTPTRIALVRESTIAGVFVGLAAVEGLGPHVLLRSGRLPRTCRSDRCEVLRLRGRGRLPDVPGLRVVEVGTATLRSRQLFGDFLAPTDNALADAELAPALADAAGYHRPPPGPLVVAEGVAGLVSSPVLARSYRSYGWVQPLKGGTPRLWEIDELVEGADRARAALQSRSTSWALALPAEELREAERDATVAGRRLLLVGGEAAALLIAFAVLAAGALRRDLAAARRRLTWNGATAGQRRLLTGTESAAVGFGGAALGWVVGSLAGAAAAVAAGASATAVLAESALSPPGILLGLAVALGAALVVFLTVSLELRREGRIGLLELAAVTRPRRRARNPRERRGGRGRARRGRVGAGRPAPPARARRVRGRDRRCPSPARRRTTASRAAGTPSVRLAGVSLARAPGAAGVAAAFLALALGLAALAESYRSTLAQGERDRAAFALPTDIVVRENLRALVPVLRAAPLERYRQLPGVDAAHPIVRATASAGPASAISGVTVLGASADAVRSMPLWREDWGSSRSTLAETIATDGTAGLRGPESAGDGAQARSRSGARLLRGNHRAAGRHVPDTRARRRRRQAARRPLRAPSRGGARRAARRDHSSPTAPRRSRRRLRGRPQGTDDVRVVGVRPRRLGRTGWRHGRTRPSPRPARPRLRP